MAYADDPLEVEFKWYLAHQSELVDQHRGRFVVVHGQRVIGVFDDAPTAVLETSKAHPIGTFLVQKAEPGKEGVTQTYHSRVFIGQGR